MHCKTTRLMPVTNKLLTCSFYGFYTQQLIDLVKFNWIKHLNPAVWSGQRENVSWYLFLVKKCRPRVFNAAPKGLCTQHFYTVLYGVMMFYFFLLWDVAPHLKHHSIAHVSTGKGCSYNPTDKWNNASLIGVFLILSQTFDASSICLFSFPGEGRSVLSEFCWNLKNVWLAHERVSQQFSRHLILSYTLWCCALSVQFVQAQHLRREEEVRILANTSLQMFVNPAETKIIKLLSVQLHSCLFLFTHSIESKKLLCQTKNPEQ